MTHKRLLKQFRDLGYRGGMSFEAHRKPVKKSRQSKRDARKHSVDCVFLSRRWNTDMIEVILDFSEHMGSTVDNHAPRGPLPRP